MSPEFAVQITHSLIVPSLAVPSKRTPTLPTALQAKDTSPGPAEKDPEIPIRQDPRSD